MKKIIPLFLLFTSLSTISQSQIVYHDVAPDTTLTGWDAFVFNIKDNNGTFYIWKHPSSVDLNSFNGEVLMDSANLPLALNEGDTIDHSSANWNTPQYFTLNNGTKGNWMGVQNKYLGLRYQANNNWYYGWARLDVDSAPTYFTIKDYAWNSTADEPITCNAPANVGISEHGTGGISLYPNPVTHEIVLTLSGNSKYVIYGVSGKEVCAGILTEGTNRLPVTALSQGMYFIRLTDNSSGYSKQVKFIKN